MINAARFVFLTFIGILITDALPAQWVKDTGLVALSVGNVYSFHTSGPNLLAGTGSDGILLSSDNGASWVRTNVTSGTVRAFAESGTNLIAPVTYTVMLSTNNGIGWTDISPGTSNTAFMPVAIMRNNFFAGNMYNIYRSRDTGRTWNDVGPVLPTGYFYCLAASDTNVLAGSYQNGLFLSPDSGAAWRNVGDGFTFSYTYAMSVTPNGTGGTDLYAGTGYGGVNRSTDNGETWNSVNSGLTNTIVYALVASGSHLIAGTWGGGVFLSTNSGESWSSIGLPTYVHSLGISGGMLLAGVINDGVWKRPLADIGLLDITAYALRGGSISPSGSVLVDSDGTQRFTITCDEGYLLDSVLVDGVKVDSTTSYTFSHVTVNHTLRVTYVLSHHTILASADVRGTITPSGPVIVAHDSSGAFRIMPDPGYHTESVIVDGMKVDSLLSYTFHHVTADHSIRATFAVNFYTLTATAGGHGRISPAGQLRVRYDSTVTYTIQSDTGYCPDSVIVDGEYIGDSSTCTFNNVAAGHTIRVTFKRIERQRLLALNSGWNMVSVPVFLQDFSSRENFSGANSAVFRYSGGYLRADTLQHGLGYWVKFGKAETLTLRGGVILWDTIALQAGWNMIGSITSAVKISDISLVTPDITLSEFFTYNGRYIVADSVEPGRGYWVKSTGACSIVLASALSPATRGQKMVQMVSSVDQPPLPPGGPDSARSLLPVQFVLERPFPNPANPRSTIQYALPDDGHVTLSVRNMLGEQVTVLIDEDQTAGYHRVQFDGTGLASGVYFYTISVGNFTATNKLTLIK